MQLSNENFNDDLDALIEAAELDEAQEIKLEREFAREYHLITRDDRLEKVADDIMNQVGDLLDDSIATKGYIIHATEQTSLLDLSQIDFDALKAHFQKGRKRTEAEQLKRAVGAKLNDMVTLNKTRTVHMPKVSLLTSFPVSDRNHSLMVF